MFNSYVKLRIHLKPMGQWALFSVNHISYLGPTCLAGAAPLQSGDAKLVEFMGYDYPHHETWPGESSKKMVFLNGKIMDNSWIFHCYGWLPKGIYYIKYIYIFIHTLRTKTRRNPMVYIYIYEDGVMGTNPLVICHSFRPVIHVFQFASCYVVYWRLLVLWIQISCWFPCSKWSPNYCNEDTFGMAWNIASHM
jgi:hypothetical protein